MQKPLIASGIYPPDIGGPATYSQLIAREFSSRGIDVSVICYSDQKHDDDEKFRIIRILRGNKLFRYLLYFWNLLKLAKNYNIIYAQSPLSAGLPAMLVSKILRKKFVIKIVGDYAWEQYQNKLKIKSQKLKVDDIETFQRNKYDFLTELRRKIQKFVCTKADKIIVPSEYLKRIVTRWGIEESKIKVIYNAFSGVENSKFEIRNSKFNNDVIISAGRPEPWKGFGVLREIMPDLLKENPKFKLVIANNLSHNELIEQFKKSKIFVLNTGYEGLPHIILEAMACGLPIITTNVCGNPEVVQNEYNGLLVEYNNKEQLKNAILRLRRDKNLREKIINNGYKTLEKFGLERMINETISVLNICDY
jgi:glycosyltransferase involved in cell wall biosynthesis